LPHIKELATSHKDKPFAVVGINSDSGDRSDLQKRLEGEGITYRNALEGSTSGPIATAWNVRGWPTLYVLDGNGVIRRKFVGVNPQELKNLVEELLKEAR
jgi:hypothetical protein